MNEKEFREAIKIDITHRSKIEVLENGEVLDFDSTSVTHDLPDILHEYVATSSYKTQHWCKSDLNYERIKDKHIEMFKAEIYGDLWKKIANIRSHLSVKKYLTPEIDTLFSQIMDGMEKN